MIGCKQIGHFRGLSNNKEPLIHAFEVNNNLKNTPLLHVVHTTCIE